MERQARSVFKEVEKTLIVYNLKQYLLRCVTSGGKNIWSRKGLSCTNLQSFKNVRV